MVGRCAEMMTNLAAVLPKARQDHYAIGSFNVYNYETIDRVIESGQEMNLPAIVAFGENYLVNMDVNDVAGIVKAMTARHDIPVVLHLDHCKSYDHIVQAIRAGFTSVMFDASHLPFEENLRQTREVTRMAHAVGVSVEAELGALAKGEHSNEEDAEQIYTDPTQAARFVRETDVDALAVSIGTVHGMYKGTPKVDTGVLKAIAAEVDIPLVLHGGSGTPEEIVRECIRLGISKINVNTEISMYAVEQMSALVSGAKKPHLSQLSLSEVSYVKDVVKKYMSMFANV